MVRLSPILAPSILASDHANLAAGVSAVKTLGLQWVHIDIMDGHFVPNLTFGPGVVKALRQKSDLFFDVHLMLDNPDGYVEAFANAGANLISIHVEPEYDIEASLRRIRGLGCQNGIVLNPDTPAEAVYPYLDAVDLVLVMTVQPGFGGQAFREDTLSKLSALDGRRQDGNLKFRLEVDGGVDLETAPRCRAVGADTFVVGTAFFTATDQPSFAAAIAQL